MTRLKITEKTIDLKKLNCWKDIENYNSNHNEIVIKHYIQSKKETDIGSLEILNKKAKFR